MSSKSRAVKLFLWSQGVSAIWFWGAISIPYLVYRGFSLTGAFSLMGLYSILVVIFEFPTGIIGDMYGHKLSLSLATLIGALSIFVLALPLPTYGYYILIALAALAASLMSGSNDALLKSISQNFSHDLARVRSIWSFIAFISLSLAGYLAQINFALPLILTGVARLISFFLISLIDSPKVLSKKGNIFSQATLSIRYVFTNFTLLGIALYGMVNTGFSMSIKTIINSFGTSYSYDLGIIGYLVGFGFLTRALTLHFAHRLNKFSNRHLFATISLIFILLIAVQPSYTSLTILGILNGLTALISLRTSILVNSLVSDHIRASVLSLINLLSRLFSAPYLTTAGFLLSTGNFQYLMLGTLILYSLAGLTFVKLKSNAQN